jgi:hypothetical protein
MKFVDTATNVEKRFSVGCEVESGRHYLSIPVSNTLVDYEEYYEIPKSAHDAYPGNVAELDAFAKQCRNHAHDNLLIVQPGKNRGVG